MKKRTVCVFFALVICFGLVGCSLRTPYSPSGYRELRRDLKREFDCVKSVSLVTMSPHNYLNLTCNIKEGTPFSETYKVYYRIMELLNSEEFLSDYFEKFNAPYTPSPPPEPIISTDSGPSLYLDIYIGEERHSSCASATTIRSGAYDGSIQDGSIYEYNGFPGWPDNLYFHKENLTSEYEPAEDVGWTNILVADFDSDRAEETLAWSEGEDARLVMLEEVDGETVQRELLNEELEKLILHYAVIQRGEGDSMCAYILGTSGGFRLEYDQYDDLGIEIKFCGFSPEANKILVDYEVYIRDPATDSADFLGMTHVPLFYDSEMGFRVLTGF